MKKRNPLAVLRAWFGLAFAVPIAGPAAEGVDPGTIEGRVSNPATGEYLETVRISIEGAVLETFTDSTGQYRLKVPAGTVRVRAFRTGSAPQTQSVTVTPGQVVQQNFNLTGLEAKPAAEGPVQMEKFVVSDLKEMAGAVIAINTQRFAPNVMNVVAADEFGPMATGNVGEILKTMPGITMGLGGLGEPQTISMNGVPSRNVPVTFGGFDLAQAPGSAVRAVGIHQVSLNNISRIEVSYTPTPETSGSALAGSVNMVARSAFERSKPVFNSSMSLLMREKESSFKETPGPRRTPTRKVRFGADFAGIVPVNDRLGFTISASTSPLYSEVAFTQNTWRGSSAATNGTTLPDTTADKPYLTDYAVRDATRMTTHTAYGVTLDYKLSGNDRLSLAFNYALFDWKSNDRTMTFFANRVLPGDFSTTFTRGFAGAGEVRQANLAQNVDDRLFMPTFIYRHHGSVWRAELGAGLSHSKRLRRDISDGLFANTLARRTGVTVSFENIGYLLPGAIRVADGTTGAPIDPFNVNTYSLDSATGNEIDNVDQKRTAFANVRRDLTWQVPVTVKAGFDFRQSRRDVRVDAPTFTYVGADRRAAQVFDLSFSQRGGPFGWPSIQWISNEQLGDLYRANPGTFTINDAARYTAGVAQSKFAEELISSAYFRGDTQFLGGRLKLVGGLRAEQANVKGEGQLVDATLNFQRDAAGNIVRVGGQPVALAGTALDIARRTNIDRGLHAEKEYLRWFPSLNGSYIIKENIVARAGYYQSVGRPDFDQYAGSLTLPNTANPPGPTNRIAVSNAAIKAWSAQTYKLTLEYYFEQIGLVSVGVFRRDIKNFFGATVFTPSAEFLGVYGLDPATYGTYDVATQYNLPSIVRMTGVDLNYKQALTFLPHWARGVQVFGNGTVQRVTGDASSNFAGYVPRSGNWGLSLSRPNYNVRIRWNYTGRARQAIVAAGRSIDPNTYNWGAKRTVVDLNAEYYFFKRFAVFTNMNNLTDAAVDTEIASPNTPAGAAFRQRFLYGAQWLFGIKGSF